MARNIPLRSDCQRRRPMIDNRVFALLGSMRATRDEGSNWSGSPSNRAASSTSTVSNPMIHSGNSRCGIDLRRFALEQQQQAPAHIQHHSRNVVLSVRLASLVEKFDSIVFGKIGRGGPQVNDVDEIFHSNPSFRVALATSSASLDASFAELRIEFSVLRRVWC